MNAKYITKYMILGLLIFLAACSPLIVMMQPTGGAPSSSAQPTQDINAIYTAAVQTIQAQTPTQAATTATSVPATASPTEVEQPATASTPVATEGKVTAASIAIELEQGSGTACTAGSTYFVHATITADGPATASYEIGSTAGQISAGYFEDPDTHSLSPVVSGTLAFDQADTKTVHLRFVGPYPYPDNISVVLRVNGGEFYTARLSCR